MILVIDGKIKDTVQHRILVHDTRNTLIFPGSLVDVDLKITRLTVVGFHVFVVVASHTMGTGAPGTTLMIGHIGEFGLVKPLFRG